MDIDMHMVIVNVMDIVNRIDEDEIQIETEARRWLLIFPYICYSYWLLYSV